MTVDLESLIQREKEIREKVNLIERLHKTCQLAELGLEPPILNEMRYLARALADVLFYEKGSPEHVKALQHAEHAARCAVNDSIDILISFIKASNSRIKTEYPSFHIATSPFGESLIVCLAAMLRIEPKVVSSRQNRELRDQIYHDLAQDTDTLKQISDFALLIPQIEAVAQREHIGYQKYAIQTLDPGWLANQIRAALSAEDPETYLYFELQPKYRVDGDTRHLIGAELLARLSVTGNIISPAYFIAVAEATGQIANIGALALESAATLLRNNPDLPSLSVNVSPVELLQPEYSRRAADLLASHHDITSKLELEITESSAVNDSAGFEHLKTLANKGVKNSD